MQTNIVCFRLSKQLSKLLSLEDKLSYISLRGSWNQQKQTGYQMLINTNWEFYETIGTKVLDFSYTTITSNES